MLTDIGKIGVEDQILMKPARLDPHEQELMRRHPIYGASILSPSESLRPLAPLVLHHHENYDGSGYPEGRRGEDIPLGSRIIIVADAYEAMTSDRIYRKAPPPAPPPAPSTPPPPTPPPPKAPPPPAPPPAPRGLPAPRAPHPPPPNSPS